MRRCGYNDFLKISCSCWLQDNQQYREKKNNKKLQSKQLKKKKNMVLQQTSCTNCRFGWKDVPEKQYPSRQWSAVQKAKREQKKRRKQERFYILQFKNEQQV